jgi:hypothetical protein
VNSFCGKESKAKQMERDAAPSSGSKEFVVLWPMEGRRTQVLEVEAHPSQRMEERAPTTTAADDKDGDPKNRVVSPS